MAFLLVCAFPQLAPADGKFFYIFPDEIPPAVPYQRAMLCFDGKAELLLLQSKYELKSAASTNAIGWVVPVPAVPELGTMKADAANALFREFSRKSRPDIFQITEMVFWFALIVFPCSLISLAVGWDLLRSRFPDITNHRRRRNMDGALVIAVMCVLLLTVILVRDQFIQILCIICFIAALTCPFALISFLISWVIVRRELYGAISAAIRRWMDISAGMAMVTLVLLMFFILGTNYKTAMAFTVDGVELVKEEQVGAYDVQVVKSTDSRKLTDWLNSNQFHFTATDTKTFDGYIKQGWCFVVAKLHPERMDKQNARHSEGLVEPLILKFAAQQAVYPLALTATTGQKTEVLLYVLAARKMECDGRLKMEFAGRLEDPPFYFDKQTETPPLLLSVNKPNLFLTKFTGRLTAQAMAEDLMLHFASNDRPYRKWVFVWGHVY